MTASMDTAASDVPVTDEEVMGWTFDHPEDAQAVADALNAGEPVTRDMKPGYGGPEPGWALSYQACSGFGGRRGWSVYGHGF